MTEILKIASGQLNLTVGDLEGNYNKIIEANARADEQGADLLVLTEMAITGYPPEDLVLRPDFQNKAIEYIRKLAPITKNKPDMLVGGLWKEQDKIYNAVFLLADGEIKNIICKYDLPNYGVFDEKRVFATPPMPEPVEYKGVKLGVIICEDLWNGNIAPHLAKQGAEILISINASPFETNKMQRRLNTIRDNIKKTSLPLIYVNQICGQDELIFDGYSMIFDANGNKIFQQPGWRESIETLHWQKTDGKWFCTDAQPINDKKNIHADTYEAMKLGLKDYVEKNNFPGVIIGLSGGVDSALTAVIAADSLGASRVRAVMMPSKYTSKESLDDAKECANLLGIHLDNIAIDTIVDATESLLGDIFAGLASDTTEENLQSRIRGNLLMAISNKFGHMVLTTGNKSEMAVGYATLYGDMCGGYNILKDIYKTEVFNLCNWRNKQSYVIPQNIIDKPPSAELRPDQKDEDSLPPYEILDDILMRLIELRHSSQQIIEHGYAPEIVKQVARLVKISEYKRRQAPPGVKISGLAFGKDRRYPITNNYSF